MKITVSELINDVLTGKMPKTVKFQNCLYSADFENKTYINIYGVHLWSVLVGVLENYDMRVNDMRIEVIEWK